MIPNGTTMDWHGHKLVFESEKDLCRGCFFADKAECPECDEGLWVEEKPSPWHEGMVPARTEGWFLVKYRGIYGCAIGRTEYRVVHQYCVDGYMWFYDGHINADDIWKPVKYRVIEEEK